MQSQCAFDRLVEHQGTIAKLITQARKLHGRTDPDCSREIAGLRWQMMRAMREYQLFKHQEVFDPLSRSANRMVAAKADEMKARCLEISSAYLAHVERWGSGAAAAAWPAYVEDAVAIVAAITQHLDRERLEVQTLLRGIDRTRRSASQD